MIASFSDPEAEKIFNQIKSTKLPLEMQKSALRKLMQLDVSKTINDLKSPPGNRFEQLKGSRKGQCSIRINDQWRICFIWHENNAYEVNITDYH